VNARRVSAGIPAVTAARAAGDSKLASVTSERPAAAGKFWLAGMDHTASQPISGASVLRAGACHIAVSGSIDNVAAHAMTVRLEDALADVLTTVAAAARIAVADHIAARKADPAFRQSLRNQLAKMSRLLGDEVPQ